MSLVHNDPRLSDVERMWYLNSCITGEASIALKGVQITNNTYHTAWRALVTRYDNKRVLTRGHVLALSDNTPLRGDSATEIQRLIDSLEQHRTQLRFLNQPVEQRDGDHR